MTYYGLLYVSKSCLEPARATEQVEQIVSASMARNLALDVTGALIFTGKYFAQRLEGPKASIDALMYSINADERHEGIRLIDQGPIEARAFSRWSMAYSGQSSFVENHIIASFTASKNALRTEAIRLIRLMREFQH